MGKEILTFGTIEIEKHKSCHYKSLISSKDVVTENALESNKISSGEKKYKNLIYKNYSWISGFLSYILLITFDRISILFLSFMA